MEGRSHGPEPDLLRLLGRDAVRDIKDVPDRHDGARGDSVEGRRDHRGDGPADASSARAPEGDDEGNARRCL